MYQQYPQFGQNAFRAPGQGMGFNQQNGMNGMNGNGQQQFLPGTPEPPQPAFAGGQQQQQSGGPFGISAQMPGMLPIEQSYIENILRLNRGKIGTFYMTYELNEKWNAKIFKGVIEAAGRDHIIISDPQTDKRFLLLMVNLDYVTFDEPLEYDYPFDNGPDLATFAPR
ncbi:MULTISPECIES: spore coat protein GerQ [Alteribacter]|uniref:Spore coat protein GerQ n=1 Tax=Alteribacter keqinensis TaxID=2483800 RepID=A0A3M7TQF3_9BACI|nr:MULTISPECIES: spore coat protein GerQ [Alteribacter]MBM7095523.1 spore coat protein GerQ [Alteribacter salitolerans]RNA67876.1 spore coat protein GerQ [Alteribacter keqinensis]